MTAEPITGSSPTSVELIATPSPLSKRDHPLRARQHIGIARPTPKTRILNLPRTPLRNTPQLQRMQRTRLAGPTTIPIPRPRIKTLAPNGLQAGTSTTNTTATTRAPTKVAVVLRRPKARHDLYEEWLEGW